jgi:hypothetical protein
VRPRAFNIAAALSLGLCMAVVALWVRSYFRTDAAWMARDGHVFGTDSGTGRVLLMWAEAPPELRVSRWRVRRHDVAVWQQVKHLFVFRAADSGGNTWTLQIPHWSVAVAAAVLPWMWVRRRRAEIRKLRSGLCRRCGYDLRATPGRCPECGESVASDAGNGGLVGYASGAGLPEDG